MQNLTGVDLSVFCFITLMSYVINIKQPHRILVGLPTRSLVSQLSEPSIRYPGVVYLKPILRHRHTIVRTSCVNSVHVF